MASVTVVHNRYTIDDPLYQWDLNKVLEIRGLALSSIPEIHFTNTGMDRAIVKQATVDETGVITADVPNSLLQKPYKITAYIVVYENDVRETLYAIEIPVKPRTKPGDYTIETDNEVYSFNALEAKINNLITLISEHNSVDEALLEKYVKMDETLLAKYNTLNKNLTGNFKTLDENVQTQLTDFSKVLESFEVYVTPQMFGAVGDGIADDTLALRNAFANGAKVHLPKGVYLVSDTLVISDFVHISGEGNNSVIKYTGTDYLFEVKTAYNNSAIIEKIRFDGADNSFMKCSRGAWGAKVIVRDFRINGFHDEIFHFESCFNPIIEKGSIVSNGKIVFTTYDGSITETNFNNCPYFSNVYITKYSGSRIPVMFELRNVRDITFSKCQLENADLLLSGVDNVRVINFEYCWFENVNTIFDMDSTCNTPNVHECNFVNVTTYDANSDIIDYIPGRSMIVQRVEGNNGLNTLLENPLIVDQFTIYNPNDGYSQYTPVYQIATNGTDFNNPLNKRTVKVSNDTSASHNLQSIMRYSGVGCLFDVTVRIMYSDDSSKILNTKVLALYGNFTVCDINTLKLVKWENSVSSTAEETFTCENGQLKLISTEIMKSCIMMIDFNFNHA